MSVNDPGKMLLLSIGLVGGFLTLFAGIFTKDTGATAAGLTIVSLILGYLTGNGVLAKSGKAPQPAIRSSRQRLPGDVEAAQAALVDRGVPEDLAAWAVTLPEVDVAALAGGGADREPGDP